MQLVIFPIFNKVVVFVVMPMPNLETCVWLNQGASVLLPLINISLKPIKVKPVMQLLRITGFVKLAQ